MDTRGAGASTGTGMKTTRSGKADMDLLPPVNRASMMRLLHKRSDL